MMDSRISETKGWPFFVYALLAFACLGIELLLALLLEPLVYGCPMNEWSAAQNISHWVITSLCWGLVSFLLVKSAKLKYGFDLLARQERIKPWQWAVIAVLFALMMVWSWIDWNGSKVLKEFRYNGWLKFIFQYIYYVFEAGLMFLIIAFGQKAFENWFHKGRSVLIPWGGLLLGLTWGLAHIFTKSSLAAGLSMLAGGIVYGLVYLLANRDARKAYPLIFLIFVL